MLKRIACSAVLLMAAFAGNARAQSTNIARPLAVQTNEVSGAIPARDLGDARLTDHFYAFTGTPGDLLITIEASNLNGDLDVFTAVGLRPLMKITVYAENTLPVTKGIYLRTREDLILRVEGRTPNDDDGTYRLRFGGSFEPITSGPLLANADDAQPEATSSSRRTTGRRLTSSGARIAEPPPPPVAEATPAPEVTSAEAPAETAATTTAKPAPRNSRARRPATRTTRPAKPAVTPTERGDETKTTTESASSENKPASPRRRSTRRSTTARAVTKPTAVEPAPESGPKLLIESNDGTLIDRYMSGVRRVTVENGQVVVVGKDGKVQRVALANVVRMTIQP